MENISREEDWWFENDLNATIIFMENVKTRRASPPGFVNNVATTVCIIRGIQP